LIQVVGGVMMECSSLQQRTSEIDGREEEAHEPHDEARPGAQPAQEGDPE
jgi:hypothetical protein